MDNAQIHLFITIQTCRTKQKGINTCKVLSLFPLSRTHTWNWPLLSGIHVSHWKNRHFACKWVWAWYMLWWGVGGGGAVVCVWLSNTCVWCHSATHAAVSCRVQIPPPKLVPFHLASSGLKALETSHVIGLGWCMRKLVAFIVVWSKL